MNNGLTWEPHINTPRLIDVLSKWNQCVNTNILIYFVDFHWAMSYRLLFWDPTPIMSEEFTYLLLQNRTVRFTNNICYYKSCNKSFVRNIVNIFDLYLHIFCSMFGNRDKFVISNLSPSISVSSRDLGFIRHNN